MSQLPAFRQLQNFIGEQTARTSARRNPNRKGPKSESANALTKRIVAYLRNRGHFATRLSSTGVHRAGLKKYVPSQQRAGLPDIAFVFAPSGRSGWVEIKVGRDVLSRHQIAAIAELRATGAAVCVASDFDAFEAWFTAEFLTPPFT